MEASRLQWIPYFCLPQFICWTSNFHNVICQVQKCPFTCSFSFCGFSYPQSTAVKNFLQLEEAGKKSCWNTNPNGVVSGKGAFGTSSSLESGVLLSDSWVESELHKKRPDSLLSLSALQGHSVKTTTYKPGRRSSPRTQPCWHPDLGRPASRAGRNTCLFFKPPGLQ